MKKFIFILIFAILLNPFCIFTDEITPKSSITSVIVYPDRAQVIRETSLKVGTGTHTIVFEGLPATLIPNSVRVSGAGSASVKLLGIEVENQFLESPVLLEIKKLESQIMELEFEIAKIKEDIDILTSQENFIKSIQTKTVELASKEISLGKPDMVSWEKAMVFFESKLQNIKKSRLNLQRKLDDTQRELLALKKKLESITPQKPLEAIKVLTLIEVAKEGDLKLNLSYTIRGPNWSPLYTLRALPESGEVEFSLFSRVIQKSGEDWKNVKVALSTTSPALSASPPPLNPWYLDIYVPKPVPKAMREELREEKLGMAPIKEEIGVGALEAEIVETGLHLNFEIPRTVSIPSDGSPHKFPIDMENLPAKFDYITIPRLNESAFLRGKLKNTLSYPIISGPADIFIFQEFVGSTNLPFTAKDDELPLYFGRDEQVKIKHEILKREKGGAGLFGNKERIKFLYRITIQNLRKKAVEIEVLDQIPISQNTQIEVKDVNINPQPRSKDEKGILSWLIDLEPQAKKEITIEFTVEYPKGAVIRGL